MAVLKNAGNKNPSRHTTSVSHGNIRKQSFRRIRPLWLLSCTASEQRRRSHHPEHGNLRSLTQETGPLGARSAEYIPNRFPHGAVRNRRCWGQIGGTTIELPDRHIRRRSRPRSHSAAALQAMAGRTPCGAGTRYRDHRIHVGGLIDSSKLAVELRLNCRCGPVQNPLPVSSDRESKFV